MTRRFWRALLRKLPMPIACLFGGFGLGVGGSLVFTPILGRTVWELLVQAGIGIVWGFGVVHLNRRLQHRPNYARIRALELELGFIEPDRSQQGLLESAFEAHRGTLGYSLKGVANAIGAMAFTAVPIGDLRKLALPGRGALPPPSPGPFTLDPLLIGEEEQGTEVRLLPKGSRYIHLRQEQSERERSQAISRLAHDWQLMHTAPIERHTRYAVVDNAGMPLLYGTYDQMHEFRSLLHAQQLGFYRILPAFQVNAVEDWREACEHDWQTFYHAGPTIGPALEVCRRCGASREPER